MKYTVTSMRVGNGQFGEYKIIDVKGEAGETHENIFVGGKSPKYKEIFETAVIDAEVQPGERGPKLVFPRSYAKKSDRDWEGEERRRNMRINWWAGLNNAVQAVGHAAPGESESYLERVYKFQEKFMSKFADYEKNIK